MLVKTFLLVVGLASGQTDPAWYGHYERGVALVQQGQPEAARSELEKALALRPAPELNVATRPWQYIDYLPNLYLAIAAQNSGDVDEARRQLEISEKAGVATRSEVGKPLLVAYQIILRGPEALHQTRPRYAIFAQKPSVLSEEEFKKLETDVLAKCGYYDATGMQNAPWYAFYELGLEVEQRGDPQRALNLFIEAVKRRPDPQRKARMYGMWLIDYYPYFQIARAHVQLENYECARDALEISKRLSEIKPDVREYTEFFAMTMECERKLGDPD